MTGGTVMRPVPLLAFLLAGMAGCVGQGVVDHVYMNPSYSPGELNYVAGGGGNMRTEISGNPFGGDQQAFDAAVAAAMEGAHAGPRLRFVTSPSEPAREPYRVRLVFNGPDHANGDILCGTLPAAAPVTSPAAGIRLLAAFCRGSIPLTYLAASTSGVADAADPRFRRFMRQITYLLLPPQNPEGANRRCPPEVC
jgi:hypothetical protein